MWAFRQKFVSKLYRDLYMVSTDIRKPPEGATSGGFRVLSEIILSFLPIGIIAYANGKSKDSFFVRFYMLSIVALQLIWYNQ